ncbi:DUF5067 domain-containing protein [Anaerovorax odorimutans]|uniref:DUF5067 domain-containing protein n=1 Tax=Anaerovorax odorimutans TaxID=109327 RepID=A0ABT1RQP1_9FIRM|nr:DUF5067 domain-containing protein [Anaerovorax odorimutans]MCQ4637514.1 DUF5067 domain-containing protein [Anaerovorax odorimutans]
MDKIALQVNGKPLVFTGQSVTYAGYELYYRNMSNIAHRSGDQPAFVFDYNGKRLALPYDPKDKATVMNIFKKVAALDKKRQEAQRAAMAQQQNETQPAFTPQQPSAPETPQTGSYEKSEPETPETSAAAEAAPQESQAAPQNPQTAPQQPPEPAEPAEAAEPEPQQDWEEDDDVPGKKKKYLIIAAVAVVIVIALVLAFSGILGGSDNGSKDKKDAATQTTEEKSKATRVDKINMDNDEGTLKYLKIKTTKDYDGNPAVLVYFNYTNKKEEPSTAQITFYPQVFQGDTECPMGITEEDNKELLNAAKDVQKGNKTKIALIYTLQDKETPITLRVTDQSEKNLAKKISQEQEIPLK